MRIPLPEVQDILSEILLQHNFSHEEAQTCSRLFVETTRDGIFSHGLNRFPRFIHNIRDGYVIPGNIPVKLNADHAYEIWDGQLGPGNLNALKMMDRAMELAKEYAIGVVALRNTNHWMRGGTYGWQAAESGYAAICSTNTEPNMPPWGGVEPIIGNNPLVIAVPHKPAHMVLDMAMSQFSFGKMENFRLQDENLPYPGGFNKEGRMTTKPGEILESKQPLPMGYWKGSGLSIMLDLLVSALSRGNTTIDIGKKSAEHAISQLFIAIDIHRNGNEHYTDKIVKMIKDGVHSSKPFSDHQRIRYPGERTLAIRNESILKGLQVHDTIWSQILSLNE